VSVVGHFNAQIGNAVELCQLDRKGDVISRDRQTLFCCGIPLRCTTDDKTIDVGLSLYTEVAMSRVAGDERRNRVAAVAYAASREAIPFLAHYRNWRLYDFQNITISGKDVLPLPTEEYELQQHEQLSDEVVEELQKATARHREVQRAFEKAKQFLESNLQYLRGQPARAKAAGRFIAECMRSDGAPNMSMWNREKAGRLEDAIEDLIRRKNQNHPGYRHAADSVRSVLYMVNPPTWWAKHPPSPSLADSAA
jgi:hypothetical protein